VSFLYRVGYTDILSVHDGQHFGLKYMPTTFVLPEHCFEERCALAVKQSPLLRLVRCIPNVGSLVIDTAPSVAIIDDQRHELR
jgi:hypothetical protein